AGLVEPDLVSKAVFASAHKALSAMGSKSLRRIGLDNVELVLPAGEGIASIRVVEADLAEAKGDSLAFSSELEIGGRAIAIDAAATRDGATQRISNLELSASTPAQEGGEATGSRLGAVEINLTGTEGGQGESARIEASFKTTGSAVKLGGTRGILSADIDLEGRVVEGRERVEVERLRVSIGRSILD